MARLFAQKTARQLTSVLADTVLITLASQITILPLLLLLNPEFSLAALPVNLLVAPAQSWIMILGLLAVVTGAIIQPLGQLVAWIAALPLAYTLAIIRAAAGPGLPVTVDVNAVILYYVVLFGLTAILSRPPDRRRELLARLRIPTTALILTGSAVAILNWALVLSRPDGRLHVWFLDAGEGNAVLVQTPNGAHMLIDGGENPTRLLTALGDRLPFDKRRLDLLVVTGNKPVNSAALAPLVSRYAVQAALVADESLPVVTDLRAGGTPVVPLSAGYTAVTDDGVSLGVLFVPEDDLERSSLVLKLTYGDASFLLAAELTEESAARFWRVPEDLQAVVMQLPSNGAQSAVSPELLASIRPQVAVVIAEAGNRGAAPAESVVNALGATPLYRTDRHGSIEIATDGQQLWVSTQR
jgi:competence protein ComEC